ncbi:MAG TPA: neuraminidase (sialidase) [Deltaproteobacteria bacterium]|nr:neuraminidase (sialidase) [Deltaproteobacteria bacterium]
MTTRSRTPDPVDFTTEHLFGDLRPFAQCHAPTLVARPDGGLLVAWFGGAYEGHSDVGIWMAECPAPHPEPSRKSDPVRKPGENWTPPRLLARAGNEAHWNPVLFAVSEDARELVLHFKIGRRIRDWTTWVQRSVDGGATWSVAEPLVKGDRGGRGAVRTKPIRIASGAWLAGASIERRRRWDAFIDRSANGLDAWEATPPIGIDRRRFAGKGLIQPTLWESSPGSVHALFRSTDGRIYRSDSQDDGHDWSQAHPTGLPNNNSGIDVVRMEDGRLALACNPVSGNWAPRTPLSVLFSMDNGETWPERIDLETGPGEFSYPAILETRAGLVVAYSWNRRRIAVARIPRRAIPSP